MKWNHGTAAIELHAPVGQGAGQTGQGAGSRLRHRQGRGVEVSEGVGRWEEPVEAGLGQGFGQRITQRGDEPGREGAGRGHGHLLAQHRADRYLRAVDMPRDA